MKKKINDADSIVERGEETMSDAVVAYLKQVGRFEVLTHRETIRLSKRFRRNGDKEARETLILHNLRFVFTIAKRYVGLGLDFMELLQEGNIGLMKAVERFNPSFGYKMTTYARWWIRQSITRAISNHGKTIRLPVHVFDRRRKVLRIIEGLTEQLERQPTDTELSIAAEEPVSFIKECFDPVFAVSMNIPIASDSMITIGDTIIDENVPNPSLGADHETLAVCIEDVLLTLTNKEQVILRHRFGFLDGGKKFTLEEVGQLFKVTRERIRQIEAKALRKLRSPCRLKFLQTGFERAQLNERSAKKK
ncbi:MAG: sigma-70 family RNA polymerase sigma factor [bacterium]|nr:sigma-70 family RNA polymerase sigma factor [bacterium]